MAAWYERASMFAMTSRCEGLPNTLLEAMASGLPAVSYDCAGGGARAIIRPGLDGVVVPLSDRVRFIDALARLMDDEVLRNAYGARAREVRDRFSVDDVIERWDALFTALRRTGRMESSSSPAIQGRSGR